MELFGYSIIFFTVALIFSHLRLKRKFQQLTVDIHDLEKIILTRLDEHQECNYAAILSSKTSVENALDDEMETLNRKLEEIQKNTHELSLRTTILEIRMQERTPMVPQPMLPQISDIIKRGPGRPKKTVVIQK